MLTYEEGAPRRLGLPARGIPGYTPFSHGQTVIVDSIKAIVLLHGIISPLLLEQHRSIMTSITGYIKHYD